MAWYDDPQALREEYEALNPIYDIETKPAQYVSELAICDAFECDVNQLYKRNIEIYGGGYQNGGYGYTMYYYNAFVQDQDESENNGRYALYINDDGVSVELSSYPGAGEKNHLVFGEQIFATWVDPGPGNPTLSTVEKFPTSIGNSSYPINFRFATNIPIFETLAEAQNYVQNNQGLENAINYNVAKYDPFKTQYFHYYNEHGNVNLVDGAVSPAGDTTNRSLVFKCNSTPTFYLNPNNFEMSLLVGNVLSSYSMAAPSYILDNVPETSWTDGLAYTGPFYGNLSDHVQKLKSVPDNGVYMYGRSLKTNIPIMANKQDAEEAMVSGDFSKAVNYTDIKQGNDYRKPDFGDDADDTPFGGGNLTSPFVVALAGNKSDIQRIADVLFDSTQSIVDALTAGLKFFGSNPLDFVLSIKAFPFSLSDVASTSPRYTVMFGSYAHQFSAAFNEIISLPSNKYINAGTFRLRPLYNGYRDFSPYMTLSMYAPYLGWQELDFKKYYDVNVNVRYYVDIYTGQAIVVMVDATKNVMIESFGPFQIATELPVTGANYSEWAQGQIRLATAGVTSLAQGATGGPVGAVFGGVGAADSLFEMTQKGTPANTKVTNGSYSCGINNYMPGCVMFRFEIHEMLEPANLTEVYGRPSHSSGLVKNFSGFLKCETAKINTAGMTDNEAQEIQSLLSSGIYL